MLSDYISFPGLGLEKWFHLDKIAFSILGRDVAWYGIIIMFGMILAFLYCSWRCKQIKIKLDDVIDITLFTVIFGVIGARLYYVLFSLDHYIVTTESSFFSNFLASLKKMVAVWNGGLAIPGGIIAGVITVFVVCKIKKIHFLQFLDTAMPGVMLAQSIGRWGNFVNVEAYGTETTLPWRMGIASVQYGEIISSKFVHPTFLYESIWNLIGFILIQFLYRKKKADGQVFLCYITWYSFGRAFIETLRTDALMIGKIRITLILCIIMFFLSLGLHIWLFIRAKQGKSGLAFCDEISDPIQEVVEDKKNESIINSEENKETSFHGSDDSKDNKNED